MKIVQHNARWNEQGKRRPDRREPGPKARKTFSRKIQAPITDYDLIKNGSKTHAENIEQTEPYKPQYKSNRRM